MRAADRRAAVGLWWVPVIVTISVEGQGGRCVYAASLMLATEPTLFWFAAFVPRCGCLVVLSSVLSIIGRCFELMWQLRKPAAFFFSPVLRLCSLLGGSWMPGFPYCAGVDQFLDSGCSGYWGSQS